MWKQTKKRKPLTIERGGSLGVNLAPEVVDVLLAKKENCAINVMA